MDTDISKEPDLFKPVVRHAILSGLMCLGGTFAWAATAHAQSVKGKDPSQIINHTCVACHTAESGQSWSRISHQRKTPEGWLMTITRMQTMHGLSISDEERRAVVKYLSDRQGLAPSETADRRYAMERRLNTQENAGSEQLAQMCGRCHSAARPLLQRRPVEEWQRLVHFHLGQWPSVEYSLMGRDRDWLGIALNEVAPALARQYPYDSQAWKDWQKQRPSASTLVGQWSFGGHMPGQGDAYGVMTVTGGKDDAFKVTLKGHYADGRAIKGAGTAILYDGYEWRASLTVDGVKMQQVLAAQQGAMAGRMFEQSHDERGFDLVATKTGASRILLVQPQYVKAGTEAELTVVGANLKGTPDFGPGIRVTSVLSRSPNALRVRVKADASSADGARTVSIGALHYDGFAVYHQIDAVKVVPNYAVARIGGNGGSTEKVDGRFDAEAWGKDASGKAFRIGVVPARWAVEPFNEQAKADNDAKFAGTIQAGTGVFTPGDAGPNPKRDMSANNVGDLSVVATVQDAGQALTGKAHLIVGPQRWNNPPLP